MPTPPRPTPSPRPIARSLRASRGFTLIELMIAMVAAMMVTMSAFLLSKGASRFFQNEARVSTAQLAVSMGMNRLVADIQRASFMASANIAPAADGRPKDRAVCTNGALPNIANGLGRMAGVTITQRGSLTDPTGLPVNVMNNFMPDRISIVGTFGTTEQFPVQAIVPGAGGGFSVYLQPNSAAYWRSQANLDAVAAAGAGADALSMAFRAGRALRIVDQSGGQEYGLIASYNLNGGQPYIALAATPALAQKTPATTCGFSGFCVGCLVNPVSRIQYDIRSMQTLVAGNVYTELVKSAQDAARNSVTGDDFRTELVREEIAFDTGGPMVGTLEIVAEYAVDLKFGLEIIGTVGGAAPGGDPGLGMNGGTGLLRLPITNPETGNVYTVAADPTVATAMPERIRTVQVRLSTRTRAPDRETDAPFFPGQVCTPTLATGDTKCYGADGRRSRYNVSTSATFGSKTRFARVRTQYADVALPNQMGIVW